MSGQGSEGGAAVSLQGVCKVFGAHVAVDEMTFEVPRGVVFGILGPNGAGKSTTLRMINDIIAPDRGRIVILGSMAPGREAAAHIGYLPEERGLYPRMRVVDMIAFLAELRGLDRAESKRRASRWLDRLGLSAWSSSCVQDLSKGMQQKVQFATALVHEPELLILDEPWSGLDPINADVLRAVVEEVRAAGRTVLFSTHLMEQAEKVCDAVCIIARGAKVLDGRLDEVKRAAARDRSIALACADAAARSLADGPLSDRALVANVVEGVDGSLDVTVELAQGARPQALLAALVAARVDLTRFEVVVPSLHQIFVERVSQGSGA